MSLLHEFRTPREIELSKPGAIEALHEGKPIRKCDDAYYAALKDREVVPEKLRRKQEDIMDVIHDHPNGITHGQLCEKLDVSSSALAVTIRSMADQVTIVDEGKNTRRYYAKGV